MFNFLLDKNELLEVINKNINTMTLYLNNHIDFTISMLEY